MSDTVKKNKASTVTFSDAGATYFKTQLEKSNHMLGVRFGVKDSGCNAKKYVVNLTNEKLEDDVAFKDHGIEILVNKNDLLYLAGTEIDYIREGLNKMVKFNNPNVTTACGCGESFDIK
ncbi:MAG: iron-sulfur cluster assembly accessory protein [Gammaproteobacteria bacterium]|nr:iron-sulfur cluster assembly accessory protein [Gammaproteobacteria bacterium]